MTRPRYARPAPTKDDKRKAAAALVVMSSRPLEEIEQILIRSYGFAPAEAAAAIDAERKRRVRA